MDLPRTSWDEIADLIEKVGSEQNVARRIRKLRQATIDKNGEPREPWNQSELAQKMTELGFPMNKTSIWKIENPEKKAGRRSISIGELIGFSKVFGLTIADLLLPENAVFQVEAWQLVLASAEALNDVRAAWQRYFLALQTAQVNVQDSPSMLERVRRTLEDEQKTFIESQRRYWPTYKFRMIEGGDPEPDDSTFEQWALTQGPTPLIAALEDVLALHMPAHDGWALGRLVEHQPPSNASATESPNADAPEGNES